MEKNQLEKLYYGDELSLRDIAKIFSVSDATIRNRFKKYGIKTRNLSESCRIRSRDKPHTNPGRENMPKKTGHYGKLNPAYKKGWWINVHGYKMISYKGKEMKYHHYVWIVEHKREIPKGYELHHIDFDKLNNDINNLQCLTAREHQKLHNKYRERDSSGRFIN